MIIHGFTIGVCSWSLHSAGAADLVKQVRSLGLDHIQLALAPLLARDPASRKDEIQILRDSGIQFTGGMMSFAGEDYSTIATIRQTGGIVPDALWVERKRQLLAAAELAADLHLRVVATHIGFIPPEGDPRLAVFAPRFAEAVSILRRANLQLLMETGQESAEELAAFLNRSDSAPPRAAGVNFDPANMILYGAGDPIPAVGILGKWIGHVHVKDAIASARPGEEWGTEVAFGTGQVGPSAFLKALSTAGYRGPLVIEREAGASRLADIAAAIAVMRDAAM